MEQKKEDDAAGAGGASSASDSTTSMSATSPPNPSDSTASTSSSAPTESTSPSTTSPATTAKPTLRPMSLAPQRMGNKSSSGSRASRLGSQRKSYTTRSANNFAADPSGTPQSTSNSGTPLSSAYTTPSSSPPTGDRKIRANSATSRTEPSGSPERPVENNVSDILNPNLDASTSTTTTTSNNARKGGGDSSKHSASSSSGVTGAGGANTSSHPNKNNKKKGSKGAASSSNPDVEEEVGTEASNTSATEAASSSADKVKDKDTEQDTELDDGEELGEEGEGDELVETPVAMLKHPLQCGWTMWYDGPSTGMTQNTKDYQNSVKQIYTFHTLEDFWCMYNNLLKPQDLALKSNMHLFKDGIWPAWEDPYNAKGGIWKVELPKSNSPEDLDQTWLNLICGVIGNTFEHSDEICGCAIHIRKKGNRVALWTKTADSVSQQVDVGKHFKGLLDVHPPPRFQFVSHNDAKNADWKNPNSLQPKYTL